MAKKQSQTQKAVKKAYKANPKAFIIAVVAIVLVIAIATAVVYFAFPETWDNIVVTVQSAFNKDNNNSSNELPPLERGDGELLVHMINVGQGDCIYIQFPDGKDMVIDCANYSDKGEIETNTLKYLKTYITDGTIEYLMLTHCDSDHVYFMDEVLDEFAVEKIYMPNVLAKPLNSEKDSNTRKQLQAQIDALDTSMFTDDDVVDSITYAEFFIAALTEPNCEIVLNVDKDNDTQTIQIIETTYRLIFYCPTQEYYDNSNLNSAEKKNAISPIGILEYNGRKIMLTGDSNEINEPLVMARTGKIDCDVLKVGHHGSATSTSNEFLDYYDFEYALISCNVEGNDFLHPRQATLDRLKNHEIEVYRTDNNGNIVVSVNKDGELNFILEKECDQSTNLKGYLGTEKLDK